LRFVVNFEQTKAMATIQRFEDLEIWKKPRILSNKIYPLTFDDPLAKDFRMKDQMRGSVGSIMG
jgi:hypothetical protein